MNTTTTYIADLFCGAGGTSAGALEAMNALGLDAHLTAINHWPVAVATHTANHPRARHLCASLDSINPRDLFTPGQLQLLWASPECTHHSIARGGAPINDQSRATAWCVTRWAEALRPNIILVENVPEFRTWGAICANGKPMKNKKGATFGAWLETLRSLGYRVDHRILCAADYGDPTTRRRLFVQAVRGRRKIVWPEPSHGPTAHADLLGARHPWVPARNIIDWTLPGESIYQRKRPLRPKTLARIHAGLEKYGLRPVLHAMEHGGRPLSVDAPLPTVTTAKGGAFGVATPYLIQMRGTSTAQPLDQPVGAITASGKHYALVEPYLLPQQSDGRLRPVSEPAPTVATAGAIALVQPFLVSYYGNGEARDIDHPVDTVTTRDRFGLVQPVIEHDGRRYLLDIRFRMLQPHELAAAQGFPVGYQFSGTKTQQVKQIGNAVPRHLARAIVWSALAQHSTLPEFQAADQAA